VNIELTFRQWCKSIKEIVGQKIGSDDYLQTTYKDGSFDIQFKDGHVEHVESTLTLEELKRMYQEETGQTW